MNTMNNDMKGKIYILPISFLVRRLYDSSRYIVDAKLHRPMVQMRHIISTQYTKRMWWRTDLLETTEKRLIRQQRTHRWLAYKLYKIVEATACENPQKLEIPTKYGRTSTILFGFFLFYFHRSAYVRMPSSSFAHFLSTFIHNFKWSTNVRRGILDATTSGAFPRH